jgi:hypothetical protein
VRTSGVASELRLVALTVALAFLRLVFDESRNLQSCTRSVNCNGDADATGPNITFQSIHVTNTERAVCALGPDRRRLACLVTDPIQPLQTL